MQLFLVIAMRFVGARFLFLNVLQCHESKHHAEVKTVTFALTTLRKINLTLFSPGTHPTGTQDPDTHEESGPHPNILPTVPGFRAKDNRTCKHHHYYITFFMDGATNKTSHCIFVATTTFGCLFKFRTGS